MRDIKSIRGDMFAYGVPFDLLEEYTEAIKTKPAQETSEMGLIGRLEKVTDDLDDIFGQIEEVADNLTSQEIEPEDDMLRDAKAPARKCFHELESIIAALRAQLSAQSSEKALREALREIVEYTTDGRSSYKWGDVYRIASAALAQAESKVI